MSGWWHDGSIADATPSSDEALLIEQNLAAFAAESSKGFSSSVWSTPEALTALERAAGGENSLKTPKNPASRDAFSFETAQNPPYGHDGPLRTPNTADRASEPTDARIRPRQMGTGQPEVPAGVQTRLEGDAVRWRHVRRVACWYQNAGRVVLGAAWATLEAVLGALDWY